MTDEQEEFLKLDPVTATIMAWSRPTAGADELWHEECRAEIRHLMPMLGQSLDRLVALMQEFDEFRKENDEALEDDMLVEPNEFLDFNFSGEPPMSTATLDTIDRTASAVPPDEGGVLLDDGDPTVEFDEPPVSIFTDEDLDDPVPDFNTATVEEIGARGMRATLRMRRLGNRKENQERRQRESRVRERIVAHLNNRSDVGQRDIGAMIGVTGGRIAQMIREYYQRLDREAGRDTAS